jgi:hypothetical protein
MLVLLGSIGDARGAMLVYELSAAYVRSLTTFEVAEEARLGSNLE